MSEMKLKQEYLQINKNFIICFVISATLSAFVAQVLSDQENYLNTTITMISGYVVFYGFFIILFYFDNKNRYKQMKTQLIKNELIKLVTSFGIGEVAYIIVRWISLFYLLEVNLEPYVASLSSEVISTLFYMLIVSLAIKVTKIYS